MMPAFRDEKFKKSTSPTETPFNFAYGTDKKWWEWLETVDDGSDGFRASNFQKAMESVNIRVSDVSGYPWGKLGDNATLVDVGGGVGSACQAIMSVAPNVTKVVVQDLPSAIDTAERFWNTEDAEALASGRVQLQVHDFFTPQPVKGAEVYFLRFIVHDWPDEEAVTILKHLSDAAGNYSKLLVMEAIMEYTCQDIGDLAKDAVEGAYPSPFPAPLPANGGRAAEMDTCRDINMMCLVSGKERTFAQFQHIAAAAGWKAVKVYHPYEAKVKLIEFVKV